MSKLKNREEFERGLHEKRKGKGVKGRKKKKIKKKEKKNEKGEKGIKRDKDKKWLRVIKEGNYLEFPCFRICTIMEKQLK